MLALLLLLHGPVVNATASERVVVWVDPEGLTSSQLRILEGLLVQEVPRRSALIPVLAAEVLQSQPVQCADSHTCLTRVAERLGTVHVITARAQVVHDTEVLTLKRLDLASVEVVGVATVTVPLSEGALAALSPALDQLLGPVPDDTPASESIPEPVRVRWRPPPVPQYAFWIGVGVSLAGTAVATTLSLLSVDATNRHNAMLDDAVINGRELQALAAQARDYASAANAAWAITSMVAIGTVVTAFFTDWGDDAAVAPLLDGGKGAALMLRF